MLDEAMSVDDEKAQLDLFAEQVSLETLLERIDELERDVAARDYLGFDALKRKRVDQDPYPEALAREHAALLKMVRSHARLAESHARLAGELAATREQICDVLRGLQERIAATERERVRIGEDLWRHMRGITSLRIELLRPLHKFLWRRLLRRPLSNPEDFRDPPMT